MSAICKLALVIAAHRHVMPRGSQEESLAVYLDIKAQAEADPHNQLEVRDMDNHNDQTIPAQYDDFLVHELVALIEAEAHILAAFADRMLNAARTGLLETVGRPGFEMDASSWCFNSFAESALAKHVQ